MLGNFLALTFVLNILAAFGQLKNKTGTKQPLYIETLQIFYYTYAGYVAIISPANRRQPSIKHQSIWADGKPLEKPNKLHETLSLSPAPELFSASTSSSATENVSVNNLVPSRRIRKPTASPPTNGQSSISPLAARARTESIRLTASTPASNPCGTNKALLIGVNYELCGKPGRRLRHAADDSRRLAATLTKIGYASENIKVVTDESKQSSEYLLECMDWLVQDVSEGAQLFFAFSGHCDLPKGDLEPRLVAADLTTIPSSTFQERLVAKVPAGAELTIVLDCCHAASMVKLKYCIGRMGYERQMTQITKEEALSEADKRHATMPQSGSLHGLPSVGQKPYYLPPGVAPPSANQAYFGTPANTHQRRPRGGVVAAGLLPTVLPNQAPASPGIFTSIAEKAVEMISSPSPVTMPVSTNPRRGRQLVAEGLPLRYFKELETGYVSPAGKVIVLAATGERQKAFEASTGAKNGVITDAICSALDTCFNTIVTHREVWHSVLDAVGKENSWRSERDAGKPIKPATSLRLQCPELWVSQPEPLASSSPVLDRPFRGKSPCVNP
ncbi:unnamed protein product [Rhizoctonia solani]|uniref:Peptidase C14 caspase domain-containing protein n=1 Tax=Rhizoctonia solani TaxID=456999 RepID=A0A8H3B5T1_9AGAM|nr:unnamed protein product [Rhizoctonia solani]